jgi:hypothetical protein
MVKRKKDKEKLSREPQEQTIVGCLPIIDIRSHLLVGPINSTVIFFIKYYNNCDITKTSKVL